MTLIISNQDVERIFTMEDAVSVMEEGQRALGEGLAVNAPSIRVMTPRDPASYPGAGSPFHYTFTSLIGAIQPMGVTCHRLDSDGIHYFRQGEVIREGRLPLCRNESFCGLMVLWSSETGEPLAFIHDAVAQKMRVAATSAVGTKYLARRDAAVMALIGTGWQASAQVQAHCVVRDIREIRVYSATPAHREAFAAKWAEALGRNVHAVDSAREAVAGADIVVTATNSIDPVIFQDWVEPGMFLTGVKDLEFEGRIYQECDRLFVNRLGRHWHHYVIGGREVIPEEPRDEKEGQLIDWDATPLLGEVVAGKIPGRQGDDEVICLVNRGDGVQFAAIASRIYQRAVEQGVGYEIPTELFLQGKEYIP